MDKLLFHPENDEAEATAHQYYASDVMANFTADLTTASARGLAFGAGIANQVMSAVTTATVTYTEALSAATQQIISSDIFQAWVEECEAPPLRDKFGRRIHFTTPLPLPRLPRVTGQTVRIKSLSRRLPPRSAPPGFRERRRT